ncbi:MAG: permease of phosphate ABC transporter [Clostridia bacterium]|nr:permease of phosphate ABC transporter [Clostridia bacterium]
MNKLFVAANQFCKESDWKTIAVLKFCLLSLGIIIGVLLPRSAKPIIIGACLIVFLVTYIPLMTKLFRVFKKV